MNKFFAGRADCKVYIRCLDVLPQARVSKRPNEGRGKTLEGAVEGERAQIESL
jgi:hypothetical protein